MSPVFLNTLRQ